MSAKKNTINKILIFFLFTHLVVWTLIPSISNNNLPLDTIEALAWGTHFDWGYYKHPPLSAWFVEFFYQIFGNQDWAYYLLSQLFVVITFFIIFKFSEDFFKNENLSLISVLLLEGIFFYNFTTPEFNVNVCQLPFWALTVYYCWKALNQKNIINWVWFGLFAGFGFLSKYLFFYLIAALGTFFIHKIFFKEKKFKLEYLIAVVIFILVLTPHLIWLVSNDYITITYALHRASVGDINFFTAHFINPLIFLVKQIGILIPFLIIFLFLVKKLKIKINFKDKRLLFLLIINIVPIALIFLTSVFVGVKIRTMWMTPFYLFSGVFLVYIFQNNINLAKLKYFFSIFLILFILSPATYLYISIVQTDKRTDYPGKEISDAVNKKWKDNFKNEIVLVGGDEWHGGNLSYHLESRPLWDNILESKKKKLTKNINGGFVIIGDPKTLLKICSGFFFKFENQGICMIGEK